MCLPFHVLGFLVVVFMVKFMLVMISFNRGVNGSRNLEGKNVIFLTATGFAVNCELMDFNLFFFPTHDRASSFYTI